MTYPSDRDRDLARNRTVMDRDLDRDTDWTKWGLGVLGVIVALGILLWAISGDRTNTAGNRGDTNTGAATTGGASQSAPAPGTKTGAGPGAPSRP
jgi:hypothetical protein